MSCTLSARSTLGIILIALGCQTVVAQSPSAASPQTPMIRSTRREVLVDLIVRDKHHRLITNLRPEEVEVYEDGVRQKVNAFRNVAGAEQLETERNQQKTVQPSEASVTAGVNPVAALRQINFVAIVLADIAPLNLQFARDAVDEFLKSDNLPNTYVSIYRQNRTLSVVQYYTSDKDILAKAVTGALSRLRFNDTGDTRAEVVGAGFSTLQAAAENILNSPQTDQATATAVRDVILNPMPAIVQDPLFTRDAAAQDVSFDLGNAILTQARIQNGIRFAASLADGMDALDSLREIVHSQENLPGRKVVLYLADGLDFPMNRRDAVDNLISYANRSGVSFYDVDTRGLNVEDPMMRSLSELERTQAVSSAQVNDPMNGHKEDDDIQLSLSNNKQLALRELAESTGGFVVTDTNEIALPMQRVMEDIRSHYELAYTPTATNYDGRFRKIEVKVNRPHISPPQYRKGYFALPDINGQPLQPFEAVALAAINSHPTKPPFPYHIAVMRFRPGQEAVEHEIAFEVPLSALRAGSTPKSGEARVKASLVALIRNADGEVVGKIGRELTRQVETSAADRSTGGILYAEPVQLPAGHYVVDAAVTDEESRQTSVRRLAFYVSPGNDFGLSSLELVREREPVSPGTSTASDASASILPMLTDSISSGKPVNLYFVVYPSKSSSATKVVLQVLHDGKEIARKPLTLPPASADGSVPVLLRLSPQPGQCDIFVTAQQGTLMAQSSISVKVE